MPRSDPHCRRSDPGSRFWRDAALPFIEARSVADGRRIGYGLHSHESFSVGRVDHGTSTYLNGQHSCCIEAGTLVLMNPGDVHACNPVQNRPWAYRMLYVEPDWLAALQATLGFGDEGLRRFAPILTRDAPLQDGFDRLFAAQVDETRPPSDKEAVAEAFFSELYWRLPLQERPPPDPRLRRAVDFIGAHYQRPLRLEEICATAGVSPSGLIRAFKKHFGITPHAYLTNRRVQFARAELRRGRAIADVALAAGFADQAHLQRAFKQLLAATPGHYREARTGRNAWLRQLSSVADNPHSRPAAGRSTD
ncbi:AraC family transcriptional regulator [Pseudomonas sp.]|uniref:helix-turn-helix transcriptional regulator n=1 Tax=Pseudomonas sp. TaxID=306 RepID=UPI0028B15EBC|nr:AraC family transcriptional regulator [Pseudomonas sp.]